MKSLVMHNGQSGSALAVRVHGNAERNEISQVLSDGTILIHLKTDQVKDPLRANMDLILLLSQVLSIPPKKYRYCSRRKSPSKTHLHSESQGA